MTSYRGRFAPSPTGPLHFGSLFAALVSYLDAKKNQGAWLLRVEDIDPLREDPKSKQHITDTLEAHHLLWDEDLSFQSFHSSEYENILAKLDSDNYILHCPCSRKQLNELSGEHTLICRQQSLGDIPHALKFKQDHARYAWYDQFQGEQCGYLNADFVLKRKEGFYAYQLAVVVDDINQKISHIIRGHDLLNSTPMQLAIYKALGQVPPVYGHFPVITQGGQKLSKQNLAKAIEPRSAKQNLELILKLLKLEMAAKENTVAKMINTAVELWEPRVLFKQHEILTDNINLENR